MDLLRDVKNMFNNSDGFVKCKNFYFEKHLCSATNEEKKIMLDYSIMKNNSEQKIIFGHCPHCNKVFYNIDYD